MAKLTENRQAIGRWGENTAASYLHGRGYEILDRNVRTSYGELDLVARIDNVLVFVEVKTRRTTAYGLPEESITKRKASHILQSAQAYILSNNLPEIDWRIDLITIFKYKEQKPVITHIENAIH